MGADLEADDVDSLNVYTAGIPAEYGRKMGGVIEVNTRRDTQAGFHGQAVLSGGSFDTAGALASAQDSWGHNTVALGASGNATARYLNPVVPENYTNRGTTADFAASYERDVSARDRLTFSLRHELSRYEIPNQMLQQNPAVQNPPGITPQLQTAGNFETVGIASYQHIFSPDVLLNVRGMGRDTAAELNSNTAPWPIAAFSHNEFKEVYFNSSLSVHHGHNEWKAGIESDNLFLHENFRDFITANPSDPNYPFDPGTPSSFSFIGIRPDLEQSAYLQDLTSSRQMDRQCRSSLGPLSTHCQPERSQSPFFRGPVLRFC